MSITYSIPTENARLQAVVTQIDAGAGVGVIKIGTVGLASVLCTIPLSKPSGTVSGGVLTFTAPQTAAIASSGTAASARIEDSTGNIIASGLTVGTVAGFDLIISNAALLSGATLSLVSATITGG